MEYELNLQASEKKFCLSFSIVVGLLFCLLNYPVTLYGYTYNIGIKYVDIYAQIRLQEGGEKQKEINRF